MNLNVTDMSIHAATSRRANGSDKRDPRYGYGPYAKTRVYFGLKGWSILDNFFNRGSEPHSLVKPFIVPMALEALGLDPGTKATWSRTAGCGCGCSPAFVIDAPNPEGKDVWFEVALTDGLAKKEEEGTAGEAA